MTDALEAGTVWSQQLPGDELHSPFGGFKRSGIGRESGRKRSRSTSRRSASGFPATRCAQPVHPALAMKTAIEVPEQSMRQRAQARGARRCAAHGACRLPRGEALTPARQSRRVAQTEWPPQARSRACVYSISPMSSPDPSVPISSSLARRGGHQAELPETGDLVRQLSADATLSQQLMGASFLAQNGGRVDHGQSQVGWRLRRPATARPRRRRAGRELQARRHESARAGYRSSARSIRR